MCCPSSSARSSSASSKPKPPASADGQRALDRLRTLIDDFAKQAHKAGVDTPLAADIVRESGDDRLYVKKAVSWALRQIGKRNPALRKAAVAEALKDCRSAFWSVALVSAVVNLLMLAPALYMLQVYDRVLASGNQMTLLMLTLMILGLFGLMLLTGALPGSL